MNARKLRQAPNDSSFKNAIIKPDLTKSEQQEEKVLIAELKRRRDLGENV